MPLGKSENYIKNTIKGATLKMIYIYKGTLFCDKDRFLSMHNPDKLSGRLLISFLDKLSSCTWRR